MKRNLMCLTPWLRQVKHKPSSGCGGGSKCTPNDISTSAWQIFLDLPSAGGRLKRYNFLKTYCKQFIVYSCWLSEGTTLPKEHGRGLYWAIILHLFLFPAVWRASWNVKSTAVRIWSDQHTAAFRPQRLKNVIQMVIFIFIMYNTSHSLNRFIICMKKYLFIYLLRILNRIHSSLNKTIHDEV